jgi:solute carrier family 25 uncoupling protein 27
MIADTLIFSALAASTAEMVTYPLDMLKTRLQLSVANQGLIQVAAEIGRRQGVCGFYTGILPALLRHVPYSGIRILTFEQLRGNAASPLYVNWAAGMTAGALGQAVASPADLLKVRMQADGRLDPGHRRYRGVWHACRVIVQHEGVLGLWRGSLPAVQRAALVNLGELSTYNAAKSAVLRSGITAHKEGAATHMMASICSGFVASVVSTPADVLKSRLMNQDPAAPTYRGLGDCLVKTWRVEGLRGLYKGFIPTWSRLGPWQLTFWVTYEQARRLAGLDPF